jgi:hypothetical protein
MQQCCERCAAFDCTSSCASTCSVAVLNQPLLQYNYYYYRTDELLLCVWNMQAAILIASDPTLVYTPLTITSMATTTPVIQAVPAPTPAPTTRAPSATPQPTPAATVKPTVKMTNGSSALSAATAVVTAGAALLGALLL